MNTRGRGRPRKNDIEAILGPRPPWLPSRPLPSWQTAMLANMQRIERELVRENTFSPVVTRQHALALAFIDELGPREKKRLAQADAALRRVAHERRENGGRKTRARWARRASKLLLKNRALVAGPHSASRAAAIIAQKWAELGDEDPCPNARTLADWIRRARKLADS